jgi:hypothetical protein
LRHLHVKVGQWLGRHSWTVLLAMLIVILGTLGFIELLDRVRAGTTYEFDEWIVRTAAENRGPLWVHETMRDITALGGTPVLSLVTGAVAIYLLIKGNRSHDNGNHGIICSQRCNGLVIEGNVVERFAAAGVPEDAISFARDTYTFNFPGPPSQLVEAFRQYYGPTMNAFEAAEKNGRADDLQRELEDLFISQNKSPRQDATYIAATFFRVTVQL